MPIGQPQVYRPPGGGVFRIYGPPYRRRTFIEITFRGKYGDVVKRHPAIAQAALQELHLALTRNAPVDTGSLRASIRIESGYQRPRVSLGPEPYNRQRLLATLAGRIYRPRKRRPKLARYYALPANQRSTSSAPGWIERSIQETARRIRELSNRILQAEAEAAQVEQGITAISGRRRRGVRGTLLSERRL